MSESPNESAMTDRIGVDPTAVQAFVCGGTGNVSPEAQRELDDFALYLQLKARFHKQRDAHCVGCDCDGRCTRIAADPQTQPTSEFARLMWERDSMLSVLCICRTVIEKYVLGGEEDVAAHLSRVLRPYSDVQSLDETKRAARKASGQGNIHFGALTDEDRQTVRVLRLFAEDHPVDNAAYEMHRAAGQLILHAVRASHLDRLSDAVFERDTTVKIRHEDIGALHGSDGMSDAFFVVDVTTRHDGITSESTGYGKTLGAAVRDAIPGELP